MLSEYYPLGRVLVCGGVGSSARRWCQRGHRAKAQSVRAPHAHRDGNRWGGGRACEAHAHSPAPASLSTNPGPCAGHDGPLHWLSLCAPPPPRAPCMHRPRPPRTLINPSAAAPGATVAPPGYGTLASPGPGDTLSLLTPSPLTCASMCQWGPQVLRGRPTTPSPRPPSLVTQPCWARQTVRAPTTTAAVLCARVCARANPAV